MTVLFHILPTVSHCMNTIAVCHASHKSCMFLVKHGNQTAHNSLSFILANPPSLYIWSYGEESHAPDTL